MIVVLPMILIMSLFTAYIPSLYSRFHRLTTDIEVARPINEPGSKDSLRSTEPEKKISVEEISPPRHFESQAVTQVPDEWTKVSLDLLRPPSFRAMIEKDKEGRHGRTKSRRESRRSWKSWMGGNVGVAV